MWELWSSIASFPLAILSTTNPSLELCIIIPREPGVIAEFPVITTPSTERTRIPFCELPSTLFLSIFIPVEYWAKIPTGEEWTVF